MKTIPLIFASTLSISLTIPFADITAAKPKTPPLRREGDKMVYDFKGCYREGNTVRCDILVTNKSKQERENAIRESSMVSMGGRSYSASNFDFGNGNSYITMSQNINYNARVIFRDVPDGVKKVQILKVQFKVVDGRQHNVKYTDVRIREE
jgi:hypothetical protein